MMSFRGFLLACCLSLSACGSPSPTGPTDASTSSVERSAVIGAAGGSLSLGPLTITVPPGAVATETTFRIRESSRTATLPLGSTAISRLYTLEPATSFAAPIEVAMTVDRARVGSRVGPTDGLLLHRAPTGTNGFEPIGAGELDATTVVARTTHFSDVVLAVFRAAGCSLPPADACTLSCASTTCSGGCALATANADYAARCDVDLGTGTVQCTCSSDLPGAMPTVSGPLSIAALSGGALAVTAHTFLARCGWPCAEADAGVTDLGVADTGVDLGVPDSGSADAGVGPLLPVFATAGHWSENVALYGDDLFFDGILVRVSTLDATTSGYAPYAWPTTPSEVRSYGVAADADYVYTSWANYDLPEVVLTRAPRAGGAAQLLATDAFLLTQDATSLYYTSSTIPGLFQIPKAGGSAVNLCTSPSPGAPQSPVFHGGNIYFLSSDATSGQIMRIPATGGNCNTPVATGAPGAHLLLDGNVIYWSSSNSEIIQKFDITTGQVTAFATQQYGAYGMAQDATYLYWARYPTVGEWHVMRKAKSGAVGPEIAARVTTGAGGIRGFVVHAGYLYFATNASPSIVHRMAL